MTDDEGRRFTFPTTMWELVRNAAGGRSTAQNDLVSRYRPVVVRFVQSRGVDASEAEDIAQEVFVRIFDDEVLVRADRARGRFRSLVLAVTRHVLGHHFESKRAQKRGGGRAPLSLDGELDEILTAKDSEPDFDREWVAGLLEHAIDALRTENEAYYRCFHMFFIEEKSHRDIAAALGRSEGATAQVISRGRARLVALIREEIAKYASSASEFDAEVAQLSRFLGESRR